MRTVWKTLAILVVTAIALLSASTGPAEEPSVIIKTTSGRQLSGALDARSTSEALVVRSAKGGITVRRPIRWSQVAKATLDGQPVELEALRDLAMKARGEPSGVRGQGSGVRRIELRGEAPATETSAPALAEVPRPQVTTISFDAFIANWDADVETDGLVLDVAPLDVDGFVVPVGGTVEVELYAPQRRVFHHAPLSGGDTLELVERWTRSLSADQIGSSGVRLRLPFGAVHPELDPEWLASWYGLVHVRLAIPGHGVFEDSRDGVRIRPWAPNRDNLEMHTGRRFLPTEGLGRHN